MGAVKFTFALFALIGPAAGQPPATTVDPTPTPRQKAIELLTAAGETMAMVPRESQSQTLFQLGDAWRWIDPPRAVEAYREAFAATVSLDDWRRTSDRNRIVARLVVLDFHAALSVFRQSSGTERARLVDHFVRALLAKGDEENAIALIHEASSGTAYPYGAVSLVISKSPELNVRNGCFSDALAAYQRNPQSGFEQLAATNWRSVSAELAHRAADALLKSIFEQDDDPSRATATAFSNSQGSATLHSQQDLALFDVLPILAHFDPARVAEILSGRPQLKAALDVFPEGVGSLATGGSGVIASGAGELDSFRRTAPSRELQEALDAHDYRAAVEFAERERDAPRVSLLMAIAETASSDVPEVAVGALSRVIEALKDVSEVELRSRAWLAVASSAHKVHSAAIARESLDFAITDAEALGKIDGDPDHGNQALPLEWPSTILLLEVMNTAAQILGVQAEALLPHFRSADLNTAARIALAAALLGHPNSAGRSSSAYK